MVVVSGLPRSGTSLVMQMVEAAGWPVRTDGRRAPDEDNPRGYLELEAMRGLPRDASFVADAAGHAIKVVAPLLRFLPETERYRVLFVERALDEVLASQRVMLERRGEKAGDDAAAEASLARAFEASLADARRWIAAHAAGDTLDLEHARLLASPEREARRIAAFLGGGATDRVTEMARVVDPTLHRQRGRRAI